MANSVVAVASDFHWALFCGGTIADPAVGVRTFTGGTTTHMDARFTGVDPDTWYMLCGVYDDDGGGANKELKFYLDGAHAQTDTTPSGTRNATEPQDVTITTFVSTPDLNYWGYVCLASIFDYQLTEQNIEDLYAATFECVSGWQVGKVAWPTVEALS
jgi:hypothetical protein